TSCDIAPLALGMLRQQRCCFTALAATDRNHHGAPGAPSSSRPSTGWPSRPSARHSASTSSHTTPPATTSDVTGPRAAIADLSVTQVTRSTGTPDPTAAHEQGGGAARPCRNSTPHLWTFTRWRRAGAPTVAGVRYRFVGRAAELKTISEIVAGNP